MRISRTKRRWRSEYFPGRAMVWKRALAFDGETYAAGDPIPDALNADRRWLRRQWRRKILDFADQFPYPEGDERSPSYVPPAPTLDSDGTTGGGAGDEAGAGETTTDSPAGDDLPVNRDPDADPLPELTEKNPPEREDDPKPAQGKGKRGGTSS